ncbi:hypothetical protein D3C72_2001900 [compost metagenome]
MAVAVVAGADLTHRLVAQRRVRRQFVARQVGGGAAKGLERQQLDLGGGVVALQIRGRIFLGEARHAGVGQGVGEGRALA